MKDAEGLWAGLGIALCILALFGGITLWVWAAQDKGKIECIQQRGEYVEVKDSPNYTCKFGGQQ